MLPLRTHVGSLNLQDSPLKDEHLSDPSFAGDVSLEKKLEALGERPRGLGSVCSGKMGSSLLVAVPAKQNDLGASYLI